MRKNILTVGVTLVALALLFGLSYPPSFRFIVLFGLPMSILNIILGLITRTPPGLELQPESANIRLVIDRGVMRASIYQLVFLNSKLIFKRLTSVMVTVVLAAALAVVGFEILEIIGALMGGITGFSLQEFLTQRMRNKFGSEMELTSLGKNDIEIDYNDLLEVRLVKSRLYLISENSSLSASFPRGYSGKIRPMLADLFEAKFTDEESLRAAEATEKENKERQHPRSDGGKLSRR